MTSSFVGTNPNQVPTNSDLGRLAFLDYLGWDDTGAVIPVIASASVITPVLKITKVSGTAIINTITVPLDLINGGQLVLIPTGRFTFDTTGNIALAIVAEVSKPLTVTYDASAKKWYPSYSNTVNNLNVNASLSSNVSLNIGNSITINGDDTLTLTNVGILLTPTEQFTCDPSNNLLVIGKQVIITGSTGANIIPNGTYYISATNGSTTFRLSLTFGGSAISLTGYSTTGLTFTCAPVIDVGRGGTVVYNDNTSKLSVFAGTLSTELASVITDYTGTAGKLVFSISPTLTGTVTVTGDVTLNGTTSTINMNGASPSIVTTQTGTVSVFNTNALTGNLFGAATAVAIGASTGTLTIGNVTITGTNATTLNLNGASPSIVTTQTGTVSVFNTNALTGNLFGAATAVAIGASTGTLTIGNVTITGTNATTLNLNGASPSIATSSTATASVFNTSALTGNLFGAATTISIGASTGSTTVKNALKVVVGGNTYTVGYVDVPQNIQSADYEPVITDMGKHIFHDSTTDHTYNIPGSVFAVGATLMIVNRGGGTGKVFIQCKVGSGENLTQAITGTTGNGPTYRRTLAPYGVATAVKITATEWIISGTGLS